MKNIAKLTIRTKIYLTIVGLLALTGLLYAANPVPFATFSGSGPVGVAAVPTEVFATQWCNQNFDVIDCNGNVSVLGIIPGPVGPCIEKYLAIAPIQSAAAGFTPRDMFVTQGAEIYKFSGGIFTLFASVGCPGSNHTSLTFDHEGTFEFKMIVTCEQGPVWKINGAGIVQFIANTTDPTHVTNIEGPAVVPMSFGPLGADRLERRPAAYQVRRLLRHHHHRRVDVAVGDVGHR